MNMRKGTHLTLEDRQQIQEGLEEGLNKAQIARELGKSPSTISKEISFTRISNLQTDIIAVREHSVQMPVNSINVKGVGQNAKITRKEFANDVNASVYVINVRTQDAISTNITTVP